MRVFILSSDSNSVDPYYTSVARSVASCLARDGHDLVFDGKSSSIMNVCYDAFEKNGRSILSFDTKEDIFENSDFFVMLPGGAGTLSKFVSYIEDKTNNGKYVPIEMYDEDNCYGNLMGLLTVMHSNGFIDGEWLDNFKTSHNKEEFIDHINGYVYGRRKK